MTSENRRQVLVAGIGNVFFSDDGFGVEVVRRLCQANLPDTVAVADYGIRGVHLAYDLLDGRYDTFIAVDALPMKEPAGTLAVLDLTAASTADDALGPLDVDAHTMDPYAVLRVLRALGGGVGRVLIVGCQPGSLAAGIGLSPPVKRAVDQAVPTLEELVRREVLGASTEDETVATSLRPGGTHA